MSSIAIRSSLNRKNNDGNASYEQNSRSLDNKLNTHIEEQLNENLKSGGNVLE